MRAILIDGPNDLYTTSISDPNTYTLFTMAPQSLSFIVAEQPSEFEYVPIKRCVYERFAANKQVALFRYIRTES